MFNGIFLITIKALPLQELQSIYPANILRSSRQKKKLYHFIPGLRELHGKSEISIREILILAYHKKPRQLELGGGLSRGSRRAATVWKMPEQVLRTLIFLDLTKGSFLLSRSGRETFKNLFPHYPPRH